VSEQLDDTQTFRHARLRVLRSDETVKVYVIRPGQVFILGRTPNTEVQVDDPRVSRRHSSMELREDGLYLTDLDSRNGTFVNDRRMKAGVPTRLDQYKKVGIGRHVIRIELVGFGDAGTAANRRARRLDAPLLPTDEFELLEEVGAGSMGRVWVARQKLMAGRKVAVKFMRSDVAPNEEDRKRFLREVRFCCQIKSPYVVECYDVRISKGRAYMIMELVHGPTAQDLVSEHAVPLLDSLKIAEHVARGLAAAHALRVVHRDVKPSNILIHPGGAKLSDFGIAKGLTEESAHLTETGVGLGSLPYASPEQVLSAKDADHRADLYCLGSTLYHLIAGQPPFCPPGSSPTLIEMINRIRSDNPVLLRLVQPACPPDVSAFVHALLKKDPNDRPQDALEVAETLAQLREHHRETETRTYPPTKRMDETED
jgi:serine/threonine protein kinase